MTDKISDDPAVQAASVILSWTEVNERELLAKLAREVPAGGKILEIGALYGGATAVLALANPQAVLTSIDEFSWRPEGYPEVGADVMKANLEKAGVKNKYTIIAEASEKIGPTWSTLVNLLWIDGGHSYEYVFRDLWMFGPWAQVIALHDYGNPFWESIKQAVDDFLISTRAQARPMRVDEVVGTAAVLRRST